MKAVYIVNDPKVATILIDPMRRAILELLRQKPMTQAQLANELGLSAPSLNFHIKRLRSRKLVIVAKREIEKHRIMQIFLQALLICSYMIWSQFQKILDDIFFQLAWKGPDLYCRPPIFRKEGTILILIIHVKK
ncbi:MAG: ArsR/SmtB family transcription factor [Nitrososphaeraceae archaeon]